MGKIKRKYGRGPQLRRLAEAVIAARWAEIVRMQGWLKTMATGK